jgi:glycosyltransferase involved in cell wall biosynthesis
LVLEGYAQQSISDFEIIIADDGSNEETKHLIQKAQTKISIPIKHIWHEDLGFRAAKIRNLAVSKTNSDYLIFTDGDCIPSRNFVKSHLKYVEDGWFLAGGRILLSRKFTHQIIQEKLYIHNWNKRLFFKEFTNKNINKILPLFIKLPQLNFIRKRTPKRWQEARTCNLSLFRKDFIDVGGFNENFTGWGKEDSDLVVRLIQSGVFYKNLRFTSPIFHLWHEENVRNNLDQNEILFQQSLKTTQKHGDRIYN